MRRILLPTDFSENAYNALIYAAQLYREDECTFYLAHTYTPPIYQAEYVLESPAQIGLGDVYRAGSMENLKKVRERALDEFKNPKHVFRTHTAFNTLIDEILETVKNEQIDLIVMGTQGATGAQEILFGTNTVHTIKKATCPVIAVPSQFKYDAPKEILFPTDYGIGYQERQLEELLHLAIRHRGRINVLHVTAGYELGQEQKTNKALLANMLENVAHEYHELPDMEIVTAIRDFQTRHGTDFLVMVRNKHTFLERLFIEPIVKKIGFHIDVPFMAVPDRFL